MISQLETYFALKSTGRHLPLVQFDAFAAPELVPERIDLKDTKPGQVVAIELTMQGYPNESGFAAPHVILGHHSGGGITYSLDYDGHILRNEHEAIPATFDLGKTLLLSPLSRERAAGIWAVLNYTSVDPLTIGLQSLALHYGASDLDLREFS